MRAIFLAIGLSSACVCVSFGQASFVSSGQHRVLTRKGDTSYEFYALIPDKKISVFFDRNYYWYRHDTILMTRGGFSNRILHGLYKELYEHNNLKVEGTFNYGLKDGKWVYWYPTGKIEKIENWKAGNRHGNSILYNESGIELERKYYKNDVQTGIQLHYNANKHSFDTSYFKNGQQIFRDSIIK